MDWKKFGRALLAPPPGLLMLLTAVSAAGLTAVFRRGLERSLFACLVYPLSFYTLCAAVLFCVSVLPKKIGQIKGRIHENAFGHRYMTDRAFRMKLSLHASLGISLLYVCSNLWSWSFSRSRWFAVLALYYAIMASMRFLLLRYVQGRGLGSDIPGEWRRSRLCAYILLLINLSLSAAVLMILYQNRGHDYPGMLIYVMALYTFYATAHAIIDIVRYRKLGSPILSTAKIVSLSAALVSMLNLETAMFAQFGADMPRAHQQLFIILTGAGVSITVVTLSLLLIVKATKEIRRQKYGK